MGDCHENNDEDGGGGDGDYSDGDGDGDVGNATNLHINPTQIGTKYIGKGVDTDEIGAVTFVELKLGMGTVEPYR